MADPVLVELARVAAGLTQGALAHELGVKQPFISQVERGERDIPVDMVERWATACKVPPSYFARINTPLGDDVSGMVHRKMKTLPTKPFNRSNAQVKIVALQLGSLFSEVEIEPALTLPDLPSGVGPADAADAVRKAWRIPMGPLPNLVALIESAGIPIVLLDSFHEKHSATSHRGEEFDWMIAVNANHSASRRRFSVAHDLGHIALGHNAHSAMADDVSAKQLEEEADQFACALLFPQEDALRELRGALDFKRLIALKQRWRVSIAFLIMQAGSLGLIDDQRRQWLFIQLSSSPGGRRREPAEFEPEEPTLVRRIIESLQADGMSINDISDFATVSESVLREKFLGERPRLQQVKPRPERTRLDLRNNN